MNSNSATAAKSSWKKQFLDYKLLIGVVVGAAIVYFIMRRGKKVQKTVATLPAVISAPVQAVPAMSGRVDRLSGFEDLGYLGTGRGNEPCSSCAGASGNSSTSDDFYMPS